MARTYEEMRAAMLHARKTVPKQPALGNRTNKRIITLRRFKRALKNSGAHISKVADRLGVLGVSLHKWIARHPEVRPLLEQEELSRLDAADTAIAFLIDQDKDLPEKGRNARWLKEHKQPAFRPKQEITLEGGKTPIQTVDLAQLNLPLALRKQLLEQIESGDPVRPVRTGKITIQIPED